MASTTLFPTLHGSLLHKSNFLGQTQINTLQKKPSSSAPRLPSNITRITVAKFNLYEILGGRGLCYGEEGLKQELEKTVSPEALQSKTEQQGESAASVFGDIPEDAFEKELLGFTGGFPGGEKGLKRFIERNPPPKQSPSEQFEFNQSLVKKPKPPELPLLLPGMIAIVTNPNNPYHMYCGIVQRITDGKAAVLFEGGVWDRLITFRLEELERREKGPPMVSPRSVILETIVQKDS